MTAAARVIVVGIGFGGLATMAGLARAGAQVTLVDRNVYSTFQPLLHQVATGGLNPSDVAYPVRGLAHRYGARFRHGELAGIDAAARRVTLSDGGTLGYDYLILATGVSAAYYGVPGRTITASAFTPATTRWRSATRSWPAWSGSPPHPKDDDPRATWASPGTTGNHHQSRPPVNNPPRRVDRNPLSIRPASHNTLTLAE